MDRAFPRRKEIRLKQHDYNQPGYYSVTICTAVRNRGILCHIHSVGGAALGAPDVTLTAEVGDPYGITADCQHTERPGYEADWPSHLAAGLLRPCHPE